MLGNARLLPPYHQFESISLQRRVCELSVPERELAPRSPPSGTAVRTGRRLRGPRSSRDMSERCPTIFRTALCGPEKLSSGGGRRGRELEGVAKGHYSAGFAERGKRVRST